MEQQIALIKEETKKLHKEVGEMEQRLAEICDINNQRIPEKLLHVQETPTLAPVCIILNDRIIGRNLLSLFAIRAKYQKNLDKLEEIERDEEAESLLKHKAELQDLIRSLVIRKDELAHDLNDLKDQISKEKDDIRQLLNIGK